MNLVGLIQPRGLGDIVISLPIAKYYYDQGYAVHMPVFEPFVESFRFAAPYINFHPISKLIDVNDYYIEPLNLLRSLNCTKIFNLMSYMSTNPEFVQAPSLAEYLKFDEYKYAVSQVPFREKWNLKIERNFKREQELFSKLSNDSCEEYVLIHRKGSNFEIPLSNFNELVKGRKYLEISEATDNIFDWLTLIERASELFMIDSCYANLVDQLNLDNKKTLILRTKNPFTPVFKGNWQLITFQ
jgi:hypothetical protein